MKKVVQFAVNYPVTISMLILGILLLGYISLGKLSIDLFPEINAPRIFVELKSGERPPEEIEKQFVEGIESQVMRLPAPRWGAPRFSRHADLDTLWSSRLNIRKALG